MYVAHFHLREPPFSIAPDPSFLYLSAKHQEALGHLLYGTGQHGGFVQLTGEVGTGKTTIIRTLLAQKLENVDVAMIHNPRQSESEFVASVCDELGVPYPAAPATMADSIKARVDALNQHLLKAHAEGRRTVLIVDEAQNLPPPVLEQVRLLTNLETDKEKLLRIMLVGQPELGELLARTDLRQLASRITARFHLTPLTPAETQRYIEHRLSVAGGASDLFTEAAMRRVHHHARGIPRQINAICDRALLGAYASGLRTVRPAVVDQAASEVLGRAPRRGWRRPAQPGRSTVPWVEGTLAAAALIIAGVLLLQLLSPQLRRSGPAHRSAIFHETPAAEVAAPATVSPSQAPAAVPAPSTSAMAPETMPIDTGLPALQATAEPLSDLMVRLISLWRPKLTIPSGENVCHFLADQGLECYKGNGDWDDLRQMNRPALLTLVPDHGDPQYVLLRQLGPEQAVFATAEGDLRIDLAQVDPLWHGEYLLLWQRPSGGTRIGPGAPAENVVWLRKALAAADGQALGGPVSGDYGPELRDQIKHFQTAHGLEPDGIAGVRTLITLADLSPDPATPTLSVKP